MNGFELLKKADEEGIAHFMCYLHPHCSKCPALHVCTITKSGKNGFIPMLSRDVPQEQCDSFLASAAASESIKNRGNNQ